LIKLTNVFQDLSYYNQQLVQIRIKQGFNSSASANNLISMFVFFNFVRPHSIIGWTCTRPGCWTETLTKSKRKFLFAA